MLSDRQAVEFFHLLFVRLLSPGRDMNRFAIKGGSNLRFFFGSIRYSDDLDIDTQVEAHTLKEKVNKILKAPALVPSLKSQGLSLVQASAPKQTETTQRWKFGLAVEGRSSSLVRTKIEFSHRATTEEAKVESVVPSVLAEYQLMPLLASHYTLPAAIRQKVGALLGRSAVQARDVFDLSTLLAKTGGQLDALRPIRSDMPKAIERATSVSYEEYKSQVVSYLKPEHVDEYGTPDMWNAMQSQVIDQLGRVS